MKQRSTPAPATCPRCGVRFRCGIDSASCWCTTVPPIDPLRLDLLDAAETAALSLPADGLPWTCLCPACLRTIADVLRPATNPGGEPQGRVETPRNSRKPADSVGQAVAPTRPRRGR